MFELAHWQNGMFIYDEPEQMPHFQITIQGNVQELLLDAYRRIDEGEQSRKQRPRVENEVCYACPLDGECTERDQRQSTSRRTSACGARWAPCWTRATTSCATRASSTAPGTRTPRSILDASLDAE